MPRSGSTLQYRIVKEVVKHKKKLIDVGWIEKKDIKGIVRLHENTENVILIKTHDYIDEISHFVNEKHLFVITSHRDIRDIFVSLMFFHNRPFENVFSKKALSKMMFNYKKWTQHQNVFCRRYEDFFNNISIEVKKISHFLSIELSDIEIKEILELLDKKNATKDIEKGKFDQETLMHQNHINNGNWGQWETQLTDIQIGIVQYYSKRWLLQNRYPLKKSVYNNPIVWKGSKLLNYLFKFRSIVGKKFQYF